MDGIGRHPIAALLLLYAAGGYFGVAAAVDPASARGLATAWDARIPFVPASIYLYALVYPMILLPLFVVAGESLFRRVAWAYFGIVTACLACFALYPVSAEPLRPPLDGLDASRFHVWGLRLAYRLDPPVNLFPSLHLAGATIAALSAWKARRAYGVLAGAVVLPVAVAVCTVKQHYWLDAAAGVALAGAVYAALLHRYEPPAGEPRARGWRSLLAFAAFVATLYAALYATFRL